MYAAGIRTVGDVAKMTEDALVKAIKYMNKSQAFIVIKAARHAIAEEIETLNSRIFDMAGYL